jgi:peptidoglycan/LPS O-acetylase OafA/YrhL
MNIKNTKQRLYWIDWIRALAAFAVLVAHAHSSSWVNWSTLPESAKTMSAFGLYLSARFGYDAVIIFFVLSGYLIGGKLLERATQQGFDFAGYALDRLTRIYVPYIPALLLTAAVALWLGQPDSLPALLGNLFQLQGITVGVYSLNAPLWTLSYEFWFYLCAGLLVAAWGCAIAVRPILLSAGVAALCVFTVLKPFFFLCWFIGAMSCRLGSPSKPLRNFLIGLFILVTGLISRQLSAWESYNSPSVSTQIATLVICIGVCLLISAVARHQPPNFLRKIEAFGIYCAAPSYTLYLTHAPLLRLINSYIPDKSQQIGIESLSVYVLKLVICIVVAWLLYLLFEKHTQKIKAYIRSHILS